MNKFYNGILLTMSWVFLASAVIILIALLTQSNGVIEETWHLFLAGILSSLFFAALSWAVYKVSRYIDEKKEEAEEEEYQQQYYQAQ